MAGDRGTVVVTGASTGIGRATAQRLAGLGFTVVAGVRKDADARAISAPGIEPVLVDVTDPDGIAALRARLEDRPISGLVNNAGVTVNGAIEYLELDELRRQFEVNLFGHVAVTQALLPGIRAAKGRIVNIGSIGGRTALPFIGAYTASKFAMHGLTDSLRLELAPAGIHVALVEPGSIDTEIWRKGIEDAERQFEELTPEQEERYGDRLRKMDKVGRRTAKMAISPEKAAKVVTHALTARRPRARYLVGVDARVQSAVGRLPAAMSDRVLRLLTA
jgi:NAD(P)-dependent dehydrogenase (short-subunit alcohol dehydrogenase family)